MKPNLIIKTWNFLKAVVKRLKSGNKNATEKVYWYRITTCNNCEDLDKEYMECKVCGCPVLIKTKWETEKCPKNKW